MSERPKLAEPGTNGPEEERARVPNRVLQRSMARLLLSTLLQSIEVVLTAMRFRISAGRLRIVGMPGKDVSTCLNLAGQLGVTLTMVRQCLDEGKAALKAN